MSWYKGQMTVWGLFSTLSHVARNKLENTTEPLKSLCRDQSLHIFQKDPYYRRHTLYAWLEPGFIPSSTGLQPITNYVKRQGNSIIILTNKNKVTK